MSEMIKRVALAIVDELGRQRISPSFGANLSGIIPPLDTEALSRAAIRAMREPTEEMVHAAHKWAARPDVDVVGVAAYGVMIDAALGLTDEDRVIAQLHRRHDAQNAMDLSVLDLGAQSDCAVNKALAATSPIRQPEHTRNTK